MNTRINYPQQWTQLDATEMFLKPRVCKPNHTSNKLGKLAVAVRLGTNVYRSREASRSELCQPPVSTGKCLTQDIFL